MLKDIRSFKQLTEGNGKAAISSITHFKIFPLLLKALGLTREPLPAPPHFPSMWLQVKFLQYYEASLVWHLVKKF